MDIHVPVRTNIFKSIVVMTSVYSSQFNCEIKLNDRGRASTDGNVIHIPKPIPEQLDLTWGYCAHEAGHIEHSDIDLIIATKQTDPLLGWLLNVIEDTRIELEMVRQFPGVKKYFISLAIKLLKFTGVDEIDLNQSILGTYLFYYIRGKLTGYPIWDETTLNLECLVSQSTNIFFMLSLQDKLNTIPELKSTADCYSLATDLLELIQQPPQSNQSESPDGSNENTNHNGSEKDCSNDVESDEFPDACDESITQQFLSSSQEDLPEGDLGDLIESVLNLPGNKEAMTSEEMLYISKADIHQVTSLTESSDSFESVAKHTTVHLRNGLVKLLESETRTQKVTTKRGRRVARGKAARLLTGNTRIFKCKFQHREDINSDVVVLADSSGSMGRNIENVKIATYALLSCLDKIEGANSSAYAFSNNRVTSLKEPAESFSPGVRARVASLMSLGGTPATQSYWVAVQTLMSMQSHKKVIIMVTDGGPDDPQSTKNIVTSLKENGVFIICLGVGVSEQTTHILNHIYGEDGWLNVPNFETLPKELLKVARYVI
ncbi:VWA domain-containing protein [Vibrio metoecus]